jgi:hypothetical protein
VRKLALLACLLVAVAAVPPASAGTPEEDFAAVYGDWEGDQRITPCRFREPQLQNAYDVATSDPDLIYTGFPSAVERELARWRSGGCAAVLRDRSPLAGVQVARVRGAGRAARETVVLRNTTGSTKRLDGARLRNGRGRSVALPRGIRLAAGRSLTVTIGCPAGRRRAGARGSRAWTCSRRELLADGGDVVRLLDRAGVVVSQRGFGSRSGVRAF